MSGPDGGAGDFFRHRPCPTRCQMASLRAWLGIPAALAFLLSLLVAWVPLVGTTLGFFGAISVWGWPWVKAAILFLALSSSS